MTSKNIGPDNAAPVAISEILVNIAATATDVIATVAR